ncbi:MAG: Glutathione-dependent formaldehyde-activating, family protein [Labilithrix sp.]|nr:Glutathione-dependent formaldehyde-activating, family protein [Labilithrix sp.]
MSEIRVAHCGCGQLRARSEGDPAIVSVCHCLDCQRRSGSAFGAGAFFPKERVQITGQDKTFTRTVRTDQERRTVTNHFCATCGGTLFWEAEGRPGMVGISLGMFEDPRFAAPARSVYEDRMHPWLALTGDLERIA